jgi:positive regulator of sigma E activity
MMLTEVLDPIGVKPGDAVELAMESASVLKKAFMFYMLPLIFFFAYLLRSPPPAPGKSRPFYGAPARLF